MLQTLHTPTHCIGHLRPMLSFIRLLLVVTLSAIALPALAVQVVAEGRAAIINGDLLQARQAATRDASQAASLQAAAWVSSTQEIHNGVLSVDNLEIHTLGEVRNIEVLDEWLENQMLHVRIRAEVILDSQCPNGGDARLRKSVALTLFPLQQPAQANSGGLNDIQWQLPALLAQALAGAAGIEPLNLARHNLIAAPASAPTRQLPEGVLSNALTDSQVLGAQFIVSGVIRDLGMRNPVGPREPNLLLDLYHRADYASQRHLRTLALDLFIHDGLSGELIEQRHYQTSGRWTRPTSERTGFATALFWQQEFGQQTRTLIDTMQQDLQEMLSCRPFSALISRTQGEEIWIGAGSTQGLRQGDRLKVYRRQTHYDDQLRAHTELVDTGVNLQLERVQPNQARGRIQGDTLSLNIQRDDLVISPGTGPMD